MDTLKKLFGERLRVLRRAKGLTQRELAARTGCSDRFLGRLERGLASPSFECLGKLARSLRIDPQSLLAFSASGREEAGIRVAPDDLAAVVECLPGLTVKRVDADMRLKWVLTGDPLLPVPSGSDAAGKPCFEAFQQRGAPCPGCLLPQALYEGRTIEGEVNAQTGRTFLTRAIPLNGEDGRAAGAVHMTLDITARKNLEEELRQAKRGLEHLLAASTAMLYVCETSPGYPATYVSESVRTLLGYSPQSFLGDWSSWLSHAFPGEEERIAALLPELFTRGRLILEYRFRHASGSWRWLRDDMRLVPGAHGEAAKIVGCVTDVTDFKAAEVALRESEARYRTLFTANGTVQLLIDAETGVILDANPAAATFYGHPKDRLKGMGMGELTMLPEHELKDCLGRAIRGEKLTFRFKRRLASGELREVLSRISLLRLGGRDVLHSLVIGVPGQPEDGAEV